MRGRTNLLANAPVALLVLLLQWPLIVAHELGHGLFARAFGYGPVRLVIGSGKTLFKFSFLGFTWLLNLIPFGGLAYATPKQRLIRWQWILFVSGGLIANTALLAIALILNQYGTLFLSPNVLQALVVANAFVIVENLLPYTAHSFFGPLDTDGKQLLHAFFYWNNPMVLKAPSKPKRLIFVIIKIGAIIFLSLCVILLLFLGTFVLYQFPGNLVVRISLGFFLLGLGVILLWYVSRLIMKTCPREESKGN